jgi:hypothetical protein
MAVADDVRHALDAAAWALEVLGFEPDGWQAEVLRSHAPRLLMNCCRQSGKSSTAAILGLHRALFAPGSLVLVVSPSIRQSSEWFRKVTDFLDRLPERPRLVEDNRLSLELSNGSRVVSLPSTEGTLRGFSAASLIVEDEAARVLDETNAAIRAMTAISRGQLVLLSTPNGRRGHFYEASEHGGADWQRTRVSWQDCPRLDPQYIAAERRALPPHVFRAEWECSFEDTEDAVFMSDDIRAMFSSDVKPLFPRHARCDNGALRRRMGMHHPLRRVRIWPSGCCQRLGGFASFYSNHCVYQLHLTTRKYHLLMPS